MLSEGCERVVILWDENPAWTPEKDFTAIRCWHIEREELIKNLNAAKVDRMKIRLVCIEREFETWMLFDRELVERVISTKAHPAKVKRIGNPIAINDPKAVLLRLFRENHRTFNPDVSAKSFASNLDSLNHLKKCDTFRYFAQAVVGRMPISWQAYHYKPKGTRK